MLSTHKPALDQIEHKYYNAFTYSRNLFEDYGNIAWYRSGIELIGLSIKAKKHPWKTDQVRRK